MRISGKIPAALVLFLMILGVLAGIPVPAAASSDHADPPTRTVGEYVSADALDHVTVRIRPHGSPNTVCINKDGSDGQNTAHLYYLGHSSRLFLQKAEDDSFTISFYANETDNNPRTTGNYLLTAEEDAEGGAVHIEEMHSGGDAGRAYWKLIPQKDGSYQIYNRKFDKYWSLENVGEPNQNENRIRIRAKAMTWDIEIVSTKFYFDSAQGQELVSIEQAKRYDSYNIPYNNKAYYIPDTFEKVTSLDWMSALPDAAKLSDLNIPGTHDVATVNVTDATTKQCQHLYIDDLLKAGVRHFDLRFKSEGPGADQIRLVHASNACRDRTGGNLTMSTVMEWVTEFLADHPGECLIFQIMEDRGDGDWNLYNYLKNLASQPDSIIWSGAGMPTLADLRGKIYIVSRLKHEDLMKSGHAVEASSEDLYKLNGSDCWALDVREIYHESDDGYPAYGDTINGVQIWVQDDWSNTGEEKWEIVKKSLKPVLGRNYVGKIQSAAKAAGEDALCLIYTSCSKGIEHTPLDNAREVHQKLFAAGWYDSKTATGVLCNNFIDGHFSQLIWSSNFRRTGGKIRVGAYSDGAHSSSGRVIVLASAGGGSALAVIAAAVIYKRKKKQKQ
ncbi:MAG: hypothetical protein IJK23_02055 [Clostridia bacterium]|nr:hypothetical protein [Clostridia bacterium]